MSRTQVLKVLQRVFIIVFSVIGLVAVSDAVVVVVAQPNGRMVLALVGVICIAVLELAWVRVGSALNRSPNISVPVLAVPALLPVLPGEVIIGVVILGVFTAIFGESRRIGVAIYSTALAGAGCLVFVLLRWLFIQAAVPEVLAAVAAAVGYVAFVLTVETIRLTVLTWPGQRGGPQSVSVVRVLLLLVTLMTLTALSANWAEAGLPSSGTQLTPVETAVATLLGNILVAVVFIVLRALREMRRQLNGLVSATSRLSAPRPGASMNEVAETLCAAALDAIGAQSVVLQSQPAERGALDARVVFLPGEPAYIVARRDPMDGAFSDVDRRALAALIVTAELATQALRNVAGLTERANNDSLTGLPNYGAFQKALDTLNRTRSEGEAIALLFIDLDGFKRLNDLHGHQIGDEVLKTMGHRMQAAVRSHDLVARVGGDEFVIILTRLASLAEARTVAEAILAAANRPLPIGGAVIVPQLSIGLAYSAHVEADVADLLLDADQSMISMKKTRRRGATNTGGSIRISEHRSAHFTASVARAIDDAAFDLAYQPIVSLVTGKIWAFEALLRYVDPQFGAISPTTMVRNAKNLGRFDLLTRRVAEKALAAAAEFRRVEPAIACMAVNVDAEQLLENRLGGFLQELSARNPEIALCLELNEHSAVGVPPETRRQVDRLRGLGILIALDDYGSQDSSVESLVRLPIDILKIDRSLVDDLANLRQREVLVALQSFGDNLDYSMIVEGVENELMAMQLAQLGIRSAQGFYFGVPQSFAKTRHRLAEFGAEAQYRAHTTSLPPAPKPAGIVPDPRRDQPIIGGLT